jgi:hypothetical protein
MSSSDVSLVGVKGVHLTPLTPTKRMSSIAKVQVKAKWTIRALVIGRGGGCQWTP